MTLSVFRFVMEVLFLLPFFLFWARFVDEFFSFVASEVESAHVGRVIRQIYIFLLHWKMFKHLRGVERRCLRYTRRFEWTWVVSWVATNGEWLEYIPYTVCLHTSRDSYVLKAMLFVGNWTKRCHFSRGHHAMQTITTRHFRRQTYSNLPNLPPPHNIIHFKLHLLCFSMPAKTCSKHVWNVFYIKKQPPPTVKPL